MTESGLVDLFPLVSAVDLGKQIIDNKSNLDSILSLNRTKLTNCRNAKNAVGLKSSTWKSNI